MQNKGRYLRRKSSDYLDPKVIYESPKSIIFNVVGVEDFSFPKENLKELEAYKVDCIVSRDTKIKQDYDGKYFYFILVIGGRSTRLDAELENLAYETGIETFNEKEVGWEYNWKALKGHILDGYFSATKGRMKEDGTHYYYIRVDSKSLQKAKESLIKEKQLDDDDTPVSAPAN